MKTMSTTLPPCPPHEFVLYTADGKLNAACTDYDGFATAHRMTYGIDPVMVGFVCYCENCRVVYRPRPTDLHVMPHPGDHVSSVTCPCGPRFDSDGPGGRLFVHSPGNLGN